MTFPNPKKSLLTFLMLGILTSIISSAEDEKLEIKKIEETTLSEIINNHDVREEKFIKLITDFYAFQENSDWKNALSLCSARINKAAEYTTKEEFEARFVIDSFYLAKNKLKEPKIFNAYNYHNRVRRVSGSVFMIQGKNDAGAYYVTILTENNQFVIDNFFPSKFPAIFSF